MKDVNCHEADVGIFDFDFPSRKHRDPSQGWGGQLKGFKLDRVQNSKLHMVLCQGEESC